MRNAFVNDSLKFCFILHYNDFSYPIQKRAARLVKHVSHLCFQFFLLAFVITMVWLVVGGVAFHLTADLSWQDSLKSPMMVSTMGPVFPFTTFPAKSFRVRVRPASGWSMFVPLALPLHPSSIAFSTCFIWTIPDTELLHLFGVTG